LSNNTENKMSGHSRQLQRHRIATTSHPSAKKKAQLFVSPAAEEKVTPLQARLIRIGYIFTAMMATGAAISTTAALISLNVLTGGVASVLLPALIFIAGFAMNWCINIGAVPSVLVDMFGKGGLFKGFAVNENGKFLDPREKILMGLGFLLALSVGIATAMLTFNATFRLPMAFTFLAGLSSPALTFIASILAVVTLVCLTAMMFKDIAALIKREDKWRAIKNDIISLVPTEGKSPGLILAQRILVYGLAVIIFPLATFGVFMTMNAGAKGVKAFLLKYIPQLSEAVVDIVSKAICLGLAVAGRIAFTFRNIFNLIKYPFMPSPQIAAAGSTTTNASSATSSSMRVLEALAVVNGVGNGFISIQGAGGVGNLLGFIAGIGGTVVSVAAGWRNIHTQSQAKTEPVAAQRPLKWPASHDVPSLSVAPSTPDAKSVVATNPASNFSSLRHKVGFRVAQRIESLQASEQRRMQASIRVN